MVDAGSEYFYGMTDQFLISKASRNTGSRQEGEFEAVIMLANILLNGVADWSGLQLPKHLIM